MCKPLLEPVGGIEDLLVVVEHAGGRSRVAGLAGEVQGLLGERAPAVVVVLVVQFERLQ